MPHLKCAGCRIRLTSSVDKADATGSRCPMCGSPLELVNEPAEILGFQSIADDDAGSPSPTAEHLGDMAARRKAREYDAQRWIDDSGNLDPAVAAELALPGPERDQL